MEQKRLARLITWNTGGAIPPPATPVSDGSHARPISATVSVRPRALALVESLAMHAGCDGKHRYDSFRQAESPRAWCAAGMEDASTPTGAPSVAASTSAHDSELEAVWRERAAHTRMRAVRFRCLQLVRAGGPRSGSYKAATPVQLRAHLRATSEPENTLP